MISLNLSILAENVAKQWNISREEQDTFSADSQRKIAEAQKYGFYTNEIAAVTVTKRKGAHFVSCISEIVLDIISTNDVSTLENEILILSLFSLYLPRS